MIRCVFSTFLVLVSLGENISGEELTVGPFLLQAELIHRADFSSDISKWKQEGRGRIWVEEGRLHMDASKVEMTAWSPFEMEGDLLITYEAFVMDPPDANNINLIFMATGTNDEDVLGLELSGAYSEYHQLSNYIMTFTNEYTRLRRNPGFNLVSENTQVKALPATEYRLAILISENQVRCFINNIPVHAYTDESPLKRGRMAFRTWHTRLWLDNLNIYRVLSAEPSGR